jgi:hypothetical protein
VTRDLVCNTCREQVTLLGDNLDYIDPDLYHCENCRTPTGEILTLEVDGRTENVFAYRPDWAQIPF